MKVVLGLLVVFVALAAATPARVVRQDKYTTKYDNIDLDSILKNDRLLNNYINCLLGKGNCTPEGTELKRILPDALASGCSKCSPNQKKGAERVIRYLIENKNDKFRQLESRYDPSGAYRQRYGEEAARRNIRV
ncbi:hypothetical protein RUM43_004636 [Polyplax serrata]|uniref:Uncharacterized protein n=1 Tax=Polyplax serrata TaxID=468196 RepID=A0AAN8XLG3_POLSC